jgi:hypothetical protein
LKIAWVDPGASGPMSRRLRVLIVRMWLALGWKIALVDQDANGPMWLALGWKIALVGQDANGPM